MNKSCLNCSGYTYHDGTEMECNWQGAYCSITHRIIDGYDTIKDMDVINIKPCEEWRKRNE